MDNNNSLPTLPDTNPPAIPESQRPPESSSQATSTSSTLPPKADRAKSLRYSRSFLLTLSDYRTIPENINQEVLESILAHTAHNQNRQSFTLDDPETTRQQLERQAEQYDRLRRAAAPNPPTTPRSGWIDALVSVERSAMTRRMRSDREAVTPADIAAARADAAAALGGLRRGSGEKLQQYCRQFVANKGHCPKGDSCRYIHAWPVADTSLGFDSLNGNYGLDQIQQREREREQGAYISGIRHITIADIFDPYASNSYTGSSSSSYTPSTPTSPTMGDIVTVDASLMSAVTETFHSRDRLVEQLRWQQAHTERELERALLEIEALRRENWDLRSLFGETNTAGNTMEDLKHPKRRSFIV